VRKERRYQMGREKRMNQAMSRRREEKRRTA